MLKERKLSCRYKSNFTGVSAGVTVTPRAPLVCGVSSVTLSPRLLSENISHSALSCLAWPVGDPQ